MLRKFSAILFFVTCFFQTYSQKSFFENQSYQIKPVSGSSEITTATDTLGKAAFLQGTPTQYYVPVGGYVAGSNYYNDKAKAQQYNISSSLIVEEVILWFGAKSFTSGNSNSSVTVKLYRLDSLGTTTVGVDSAFCPGSVIDSVTLLIDSIKTSGYTIVAFPSHPIAYLSFAAGIDLTPLALGDSVGLITNTDGNAGETERSWEQWNNGSWHTMFQAWPLDIDFAIWPVIDTSSTGINDAIFFNGMKMSQNQPNPTNSETIIQYEIQNNAAVNFEIFDVTGKIVFTQNLGLQNKGKHSINIATENYTSGIYYYSLIANDKRITKKMLINK